jgi:hypothetical protein
VTQQDAPLPPRNKKKKKKTTGDLRLEKAFRILEQAGDSDESQAFGIFENIFPLYKKWSPACD